MKKLLIILSLLISGLSFASGKASYKAPAGWLDIPGANVSDEEILNILRKTDLSEYSKDNLCFVDGFNYSTNFCIKDFNKKVYNVKIVRFNITRYVSIYNGFKLVEDFDICGEFIPSFVLLRFFFAI